MQKHSLKGLLINESMSKLQMVLVTYHSQLKIGMDRFMESKLGLNSFDVFTNN